MKRPSMVMPLSGHSSRVTFKGSPVTGQWVGIGKVFVSLMPSLDHIEDDSDRIATCSEVSKSSRRPSLEPFSDASNSERSTPCFP